MAEEKIHHKLSKQDEVISKKILKKYEKDSKIVVEVFFQVKEDISAFNETTYTCVYIMANLSNLLNPFIPSSADKIKNMLGLQPFKWEEYQLDSDIKINNLELLFERIDD